MNEQSLARAARPIASLRTRLMRVLTASLLAGCASAPISEPPEPRPLGAELPAYDAPSDPTPFEPASAGPGSRGTSKPGASEASPTVPPMSPEGLVSLDDALAAALLQSPDLASFSWEIRSREARALQAGLLPNPTLGVNVEDFAGSGEASGFDGSESTFLLSQTMPTAGKRVKGREAARIGADVAAWEYESARLALFASVQRAFFNLLAAQEQVTLSDELLRLAESSVAEVERLVEAGATPPAERTRAAVEAATARVDRAKARRALQAARASLAATWGAPAPTFDRAEGELGGIIAPPEVQTVRSWLARNPDLARWNREIARREAVVALEDARRFPDVTASIGLRHLEASDDQAVVAQLSVPLPVFDRNQGTRAAARSDLRKAKHQRHAARAKLSAALESAYQELDARFVEVSSLQDEILPGAAEAFQQVRRGYARGLFRNVDVLDAQRRLFALRLRELDALRAYHAARAELERLTGTPLAAPEGARP